MLRRDWTVPAATQLAHAQDHYHALNPTAAAAMARQVREATAPWPSNPAVAVPAGLQVPANGR